MNEVDRVQGLLFAKRSRLWYVSSVSNAVVDYPRMLSGWNGNGCVFRIVSCYGVDGAMTSVENDC